ncbi:MAG: 3'(2'),5'-bisphosphate nucleotidase CysQ [Candidatus Hydrogenedentota bacterium]|nr:MAG: 3'(2'),5'-bisphosphate nucleotidase CysQ [Candidatus Hydrogenedentota bacterium]
MSLSREDIAFVDDLVLKAGKKLMEYYGIKDLKIREKSKNNPVTLADFAANEVLIKGLMQRFPNDSILSEEESQKMAGGIHKGENHRLWILDPLDGTKEFIEKNPQFTVSVGFISSGEPMLGWLYNPAQDIFYSGGIEIGFFKNGKKCTRKQQNKQDKPLLAISRTEAKKGYFDFILEEKDYPKPLQIGSIAWKLALLAAGEIDLVVSRKPKNLWDVAGAAALLKTHSLLFMDKEFKPWVFNPDRPLISGVVAGTKEAIEQLKELLAAKQVKL